MDGWKRVFVGALLAGVVLVSQAHASGSCEATVRTAPVSGGGTPPSAKSEDSTGQDGAAEAVPVVLTVTAGEHFMHKLKVMPLVRVKNHPQMAAWCETEDGQFVSTLFITERVATQNWRGAPADPTPTDDIRREESLPVWAHRHGDTYADGAHLPTRENPMPDAVTAATPTAGFDVHTELPGEHETVWVYFEVNNSTDFNEFYTEDASRGSAAYSGGRWGSGQPALVYGARVETDTRKQIKFHLLGHSSPDGANGRIYEDTSRITTATSILEGVSLTVRSKSPR